MRPFFPPRFGNPAALAGASYVGPLDDYTTEGMEFYCVGRKLVGSYGGDCMRVRRSSDSTLSWIPFTSEGLLDSAALTTFLSGSNGFCHTLPGQLNGRNLSQTTAAAQPQLAQDGDGEWYLYAPGAGFTTTAMNCVGLSIACTNCSYWLVASSTGYTLGGPSMRDNTLVKERSFHNHGSSMSATLNENATGTVASIGSTNAGIYSTVVTFGSGGNRLTNRLTSSTGTRTPNALNVNDIYMGQANGGPNWSQNSRIYAQALWTSDLGSAVADELATLGQTLFNAQ